VLGSHEVAVLLVSVTVMRPVEVTLMVEKMVSSEVEGTGLGPDKGSVDISELGTVDNGTGVMTVVEASE